jgi:hypothetical protein
MPPAAKILTRSELIAAEQAKILAAMKNPERYRRGMEIVETPKAKRGMNGLETEYANHLEARRVAGEITAWWYNSIRVKLADGAWFKPDYCVLLITQTIEFHEVKGGFCREAALVRLKVAAKLYSPFPFFLVRKINGVFALKMV